MIFKLNGTIEETLALTPVIKEWHEMSGEKVIVDTLYPDLFFLNPSVARILGSTESLDEACFDFSSVCWQKYLLPVTEVYAKHVLGKANISNWRTFMMHPTEDDETANAIRFHSGYSGRTALVSLKQDKAGLLKGLEEREYNVLDLGGITPSRGVWRALAQPASLYIGEDGPETAIALTTDVPAVVCYSFRNPVYFAPFRRGIPFEAIVPGKVCGMAGSCLQGNGRHEFNRTYRIKCPQPVPYVCKEYVTTEMILQAVDKIGGKKA